MKEIRVLLLNGSPRANGNTALALREMEKVFAQNGVQTETVLLGNQAIRGCTACGACAKLGRCVFDDAVNELAPKLEAADGLVVASPVYYASANATLVACLDRLFYPDFGINTYYAFQPMIVAGNAVTSIGRFAAPYWVCNGCHF